MMTKKNECRCATRALSCAVRTVAFMVACYTIPAQAAQIGVLDETAMTYTITVAEGETVVMSAEDAYALTNLVEGYTFVKDGPGTLSVGAQVVASAHGDGRRDAHHCGVYGRDLFDPSLAAAVARR